MALTAVSSWRTLSIGLITASILFAGCSPEGSSDSQALTYDSCVELTSSDYSIEAIETIVTTWADEWINYPMSLSSDVFVKLNGIGPDSIADVTIWYPDGTVAVSGDFWTSSWLFEHLNIARLNFQSYGDPQVKRAIPMTGYCIAMIDTNGNVVRQPFSLEMPDGSAPSLGAQYVHPADYNISSASNLEVPTLVNPIINSAELIDTEILLNTTVDNDDRITEFQVNFWDINGKRVATYFTDVALDVPNSGFSVDYPILLSDLDFVEGKTVDDIDDLTAFVFDHGVGVLAPLSQLNTWGYPFPLTR